MYAYEIDVPMSLDLYDEVAAEMENRVGRPLAPGCLLHLAVRTDTGMRITEVWESHGACDRFGDDVVLPAMETVMGPDAMAAGEPPQQEELDLHRLLLASPSRASAGAAS